MELGLLIGMLCVGVLMLYAQSTKHTEEPAPTLPDTSDLEPEFQRVLSSYPGGHWHKVSQNRVVLSAGHMPITCTFERTKFGLPKVTLSTILSPNSFLVHPNRPEQIDRTAWEALGIHLECDAHGTGSVTPSFHHGKLFVSMPTPVHELKRLCELIDTQHDITHADAIQRLHEHITTRKTPWAAATAAMRYLIEQDLEDPTSTKGYTPNALPVVLHHLQTIRRRPDWLRPEEIDDVLEAFADDTIDSRAVLEILGTLHAHSPDDAFWGEDVVQHHITQTMRAHPDDERAFALLLDRRGDATQLTQMLLTQLDYLRGDMSATARHAELLEVNWPEEMDFSSELADAYTSGEYDQGTIMLGYGVLAPNSRAFTEHSESWLTEQDTQGVTLSMWEQQVEHHRTILGEREDFMEMLVGLACYRGAIQSRLAITLVLHMIDSPHLITLLELHLPSTRPHTPEGWKILASELVEHLPTEVDEAFYFALDLVMNCPDKKVKRVWLNSIDPDDLRYQAFQIWHHETPGDHTMYLGVQLARIAPSPLPTFVRKALLHLVEHDGRASAYRKPLGRLSQEGDPALLRELMELLQRARFATNKRVEIEGAVEHMKKKLGARGGELTLSQEDHLRGRLSQS